MEDSSVYNGLRNGGNSHRGSKLFYCKRCPTLEGSYFLGKCCLLVVVCICLKVTIFYCRMENSINEGDAWGDNEENDYFNDNPNARPPSPSPRQRIPSEYAFPPSNLPVIHLLA